MPLRSVLLLAHVVGLALGVGAATVKLVLLLASTRDEKVVPAFLYVVRPITRLIVAGTLLLALSGIGWLIVGYPFTPLLGAKLVLVVVGGVLGPIVDKVVEPRFRALAPGPGAAPSPAFAAARSRFIVVEAVATGMFYGAMVIGVLL